ncbi:MAG: hypothetical protein J0M04_05310 [Verrucomicrobia bacterium]|nr:hypothetical protein [Verrucomicrobiota bacterium]
MSEIDPIPAIDDLSLRILHDLADDDERAELARLLATSPDNRRRFLDHAALHGMLAREAKAGAMAENPHAFFGSLEKVSVRKTSRLSGFWLPAAAAVIVACIAILTFMPTNAMAALDRIIAAMNEARDRSYTIEVINAGPDSGASRSDRGRFPPANHLDGATLWLRGPGEFVLRQTLPNGETRIIGGDGTQSWSMKGDGPVRVSPDLNRFGRAIFDPNGEVAFLDLRTQLDQLRRLYQIEWLDRSSRETWKLRGLRRSHEQGGPREIELWFSPDNGLIQRMILNQLPRGNGGPVSIAIILRSTEPLAPDYFQHTSHHEPGRTLLAEP